MPNQQPIRIKTISEYHKFMQLPKPAHPLVSGQGLRILNGLTQNR